jgi:hypothetical protein
VYEGAAGLAKDIERRAPIVVFLNGARELVACESGTRLGEVRALLPG